MKYRRWWFLAILVLGSLLASTALAQTTMQQREAEERGEQDPEDEEDEQQPDERSTTDPERQEDEPEEEEERDPIIDADDYVESYWARYHMPGLRLDAGSDFDGTTAWALGLGYMYALQWHITIIRSETIFRGGIGPDLMFVFGSDNGFDGMIGHLRGRITGVGPRGGLTLEGGGVMALGHGGGIGITAGVFLASQYFELGYFYQAVLGNADWVTPHNLGLRLHIPLLEH